MKEGLSRHEDPTGLLLKGSQIRSAASDAASGMKWRGNLQREKYSSSGAWVPSNNLHSQSAPSAAQMDKERQQKKKEIEDRYHELLDKTYQLDEMTHLRGVDTW